MSKFSALFYLNAYNDTQASNAPDMSNFKWTRNLNGLIVSNPVSQQAVLAPGENKALFSGTRTLAQDTTTQYSIALAPGSSSAYQLSAVAGTLPNFRTPRALSTDATTQVNISLNGPQATINAPSITALAASFTGTIGGMATSVTITAVTPGLAGNVLLPIDGVSSVSTLIANWNTANPSNMLGLTSGDGTQIPTGGSFILTGGLNGATAMNTSSVQVGDYILIGSNFNVLNQGIWQIISVSANSVAISNLGGVNEGPIVLGSGFASQIQIFSAAGVQAGDTLVISGGFSPITQGAYIVTQVTANTLQFIPTIVLPQQSNVQTEAISIYSSAKSLIYLEADQNTSVIVNGNAAGNILPFVIPAVIGSTTQPGVFMLKSTVYSLSVQNNSVSPANIFYASVE